MPVGSYRSCNTCAYVNPTTRRRCRRKTCKYGPFCYQHTAKANGVKIKKSHGRGYGLFATKNLRPGTSFNYTGKLVCYEDTPMSAPDYDDKIIPYGMLMVADDDDQLLTDSRGSTCKTVIVDACLTNDSVARYINAANDDETENCVTEIRTNSSGDDFLVVVVTRTVRSGQELLLRYDDDFDFRDPSSEMTKPQQQEHRQWCLDRNQARGRSGTVDEDDGGAVPDDDDDDPDPDGGAVPDEDDDDDDEIEVFEECDVLLQILRDMVTENPPTQQEFDEVMLRINDYCRGRGDDFWDEAAKLAADIMTLHDLDDPNADMYIPPDEDLLCYFYLRTLFGMLESKPTRSELSATLGGILAHCQELDLGTDIWDFVFQTAEAVSDKWYGVTVTGDDEQQEDDEEEDNLKTCDGQLLALRTMITDAPTQGEFDLILKLLEETCHDRGNDFWDEVDEIAEEVMQRHGLVDPALSRGQAPATSVEPTTTTTTSTEDDLDRYKRLVREALLIQPQEQDDQFSLSTLSPDSPDRDDEVEAILRGIIDDDDDDKQARRRIPEQCQAYIQELIRLNSRPTSGRNRVLQHELDDILYRLENDERCMEVDTFFVGIVRTWTKTIAVKHKLTDALGAEEKISGRASGTFFPNNVCETEIAKLRGLMDQSTRVTQQLYDDVARRAVHGCRPDNPNRGGNLPRYEHARELARHVALVRQESIEEYYMGDETSDYDTDSDSD